jgi:NAD(P)-dependent dehydrogenase (short-subunit alcohol dehydrogenase family)
VKNIVIIGASSGIGAALAEQQVQNGNNVFGTYFKNNTRSRVQLYPLNVLDQHVDLSFAPDIVDGLVYCPGRIELKPFSRLTAEDFRNDYELQVTGAVKVIQALLPKLKKASSPSIVLFSTVAVQLGFNFHSLVASSKGAVEGLARALAAELAPKIRVNCIAPSVTNTPLASPLLNTDEKREASAQRHPLKRIGEPSDIANMASFLLSESASWVTGQVIHADGGMSVIK